MTPRLRAYLLLTAAPAIAAVALLLRVPAAAPGDPVLMVVLIAMGVAAANFPVMVSARYKADASPAIDLAFVILFPPATAVALVGLTRILGDGSLCLRTNPATGTRRRAPIDLVFNTSQLMLAAACSAVIYHGITTTGVLGGSLLAEPVGAALAAIALYVVSNSAVAIATSRLVGRTAIEIWAEAAAVELKPDAAIYASGYVLALVANGRPWLALVMIAPLAGLQLALKRAAQMRDQTLAAVEAMADMVDRRDSYTFQHSQSVAEHAVRTARRLRLADGDVETIRLAARVHDLGKIAVPDSVLHKHGRLTDEEFALMKKHPQDGAEILSKFPEYRAGRELVLAHHERIDGRGYPHGLSGDAIPLGARVIAVADAWDAMTSDRPYREALPQSVALAELMRGRGTQWDASVVDAFAASLPGTEPLETEREAGLAAPLLRSLGAVAGVLTTLS